jgi:Spy/CpxP family protein refolding chaperone
MGVSMKRAWFLSLAGVVLATSAWSQHYGMGSGMMEGYGGGYGMGPRMMGGYWGLDLSADQRKKIDQIQDEAANARWQLMGPMHQKGFHMDSMLGGGPFDELEARKAFQAMTDSQKAMFELSLTARKRIDAILTKEQREKLRNQ